MGKKESCYSLTKSGEEEKAQIFCGNGRREDEWKAFRIKGQMEFSLIGILSGISTILAGKAIGIFAISTFNTDYILVKQDDFEKAINALDYAGYTI